MDIYRTPDARFESLPGYAFEPHYASVGGMRMHYLDEGDRASASVLMLHGEPTWSYLYRHMIGVCAQAGHRVVVPDLIGFGKSDKPTRAGDYSYQSHVDWLKDLLGALDLRRITLFCQDWRALIGLRVAAEDENRFERIIVGNGALPTLESDARVPLANAAAFLSWRLFARVSPWFPIGAIVNAGCRRTLTPEERRAYDAPFPEDGAMAGARAFPALVPIGCSPRSASWSWTQPWTWTNDAPKPPRMAEYRGYARV